MTPKLSTVVSLLMTLAAGVAIGGDERSDSASSKTQDVAVDEKKASETKAPPTRKELFRGEVVFLHDALKKRGVNAYEEELSGQIVLDTSDGRLIPIVPDWRGRAFYQDDRLRNRRVELIGQRKSGLPYLQVLMVFTFDENGGRQYTDYWCDICAIPMYEIKLCECCQGDIELRFQPQDLPDYIKKPAHEQSTARSSEGDHPAGRNSTER